MSQLYSFFFDAAGEAAALKYPLVMQSLCSRLMRPGLWKHSLIKESPANSPKWTSRELYMLEQVQWKLLDSIAKTDNCYK
jgi:hypothetical protein